MSDSRKYFICEVVVWMLFTYCNFNFSVSCSFIVNSACFCLSTSFRKFLSDSRNENGCYALFFIDIFLNFGVRVIIKFSVIFVFF